MPRSRNVIARVITLLLLGALINIALAWIAMFLPKFAQGYGPPATEDLGVARSSSPDRHEIWQISRGRNAWHTAVMYWHMQVSGYSLMIPEADYEARKFDLSSLPSHLQPASLDELNMLAWYREVGWPMKSLTCSIHWQTQVRNEDVLYTVRGGVQLPRDKGFQPRALPLTPVWPGFAINTIFYALVMWMAFALPSALRRKRRTTRGLCPACAYPVGTSPVCTECGKAVTTLKRGLVPQTWRRKDTLWKW